MILLIMLNLASKREMMRICSTAGTLVFFGITHSVTVFQLSLRNPAYRGRLDRAESKSARKLSEQLAL